MTLIAQTVLLKCLPPMLRQTMASEKSRLLKKTLRSFLLIKAKSSSVAYIILGDVSLQEQ